MFGTECQRSGFSSLLLPLLYCFRFGGILLVTPYHDQSQETPHNGDANQYQNDGDSDCPDAWWEVGVHGMALVDEWLEQIQHISRVIGDQRIKVGYRRKGSNGGIGEDCHTIKSVHAV